MALDTVDVKQSRAVKKNIAPASGGTTHRAGPILEDSVADRHRLPAAVRRGDQHARLLRVQGMAPHRAGRSRGGGVGDGVGQHAAAGVRVAAAERRHAAAVRHLRGRRRPQAGRRDRGRERRRHQRRQHPQRAGTVRGPDRRQRRRPRPRVELRRHQGDLRGAGQRARAASICGCSTCAGGTCRAAHQRRRPPGQRRARPQLRSGVRARRQRRVRVDARRDADAVRRACPTSNLYRVGPGLDFAQPRADDVPAQLGDRAGVHAGRPRQHDDREGATDRRAERRLLSAGRPPHQLGPDRLPPAARAARAVDRHVHERPAAVGRLPAGDRDPRGAGPQLPHHPVRRRRARAAAARWRRSTVRSGRSRPTAPR